MNTVLKELLEELTPEQFDEFKSDKMLNKIYSMSGDSSIDDIVANAQATASSAMLRYLYPRKTGIAEWTGATTNNASSGTASAAPTATAAADSGNDTAAPAGDTVKPGVKLAEPAPEYDLSDPDSLPLWMKMKLKKEGKL